MLPCNLPPISLPIKKPVSNSSAQILIFVIYRLSKNTKCVLMGIGNGVEAAGIGIPASGISVRNRSIPVSDPAITGTIAGVSSVAGYPDVDGAPVILIFSLLLGPFNCMPFCSCWLPCSYCRPAFVGVPAVVGVPNVVGVPLLIPASLLQLVSLFPLKGSIFLLTVGILLPTIQTIGMSKIEYWACESENLSDYRIWD